MKNYFIEQFEKSGLAKISDFNSESYYELFTKLEDCQKNYFEKLQSISTEDYFKKWPKDTLHWWSRIWEYPYVYYHINKLLQTKISRNISILDFGCGVNFFPLEISRLGHEVTCLDNDKMCINTLLNFKHKYSETNIRPILNSGINIPLPDKSIDIIYSISVFEHVNQLGLLVKEIYRVMKDEGRLIITFDVSLNESHELSKKSYEEFVKELFTRFSLVYEYKPIHPSDIMNSRNSPLPYNNKSFKEKIIFALKNYLIRPILLKKPHIFPQQLVLAVEGMVLSKSIY